MGTILDDLYDHEGWASRRLPDGTLTGTWTAATADFRAYRPQCSCDWVGRSDYPPTQDGEDQALREWERDHARPLLVLQSPAELASEIADVCRRLSEFAEDRPLAALRQVRQLAKWADVLSERAAGNARRDGAGWNAIGQAAGTSEQAAQQRYGRRAG